MRLYVPEIGDQLWLSQDWKFWLHEERRNESLLKIIVPGYTKKHWSEPSTDHACVIPAGTELIVARVYIRNGARDFSSLTFRIGYCEHKVWRKKRFWAKLSDVNRIQFLVQVAGK